MICKICNKDFKSNRSLGIHIAHTHNIDTKEYYDKYLKKKNEGICLNCEIKTDYLNLTKGYRLFCSKTCCNKSTYHQIKMQNTIIKRYGGLGTASNIINEKIKNTNIQKYGTKNVYASNYGKSKIIQTNLKKYGTQYAFQADVVKNKIVQTSLDRYGTTNPANSPEGRKKANITMRVNGNKSTWEDYFENQCKKLNINYKSNYNLDPRYPFYCDFYLPNTDTFIEINGFWSHGKHFFDENNQNDLKILAKWKKKADQGHRQYINAIDVWTNRDKEKLKCAIKNKLNYIVIWTYTDLVNYFKDKEEDI